MVRSKAWGCDQEGWGEEWETSVLLFIHLDTLIVLVCVNPSTSVPGLEINRVGW